MNVCVKMDQRHLHISCIFNTHHAYTSCIHISCTHNSMHTTDTHNTHTTRTHITALEPHVDTTNVFHRHIHTYPHTSTHIHTHPHTHMHILHTHIHTYIHTTHVLTHITALEPHVDTTNVIRGLHIAGESLIDPHTYPQFLLHQAVTRGEKGVLLYYLFLW